MRCPGVCLARWLGLFVLAIVGVAVATTTSLGASIHSYDIRPSSHLGAPTAIGVAVGQLGLGAPEEPASAAASLGLVQGPLPSIHSGVATNSETVFSGHGGIAAGDGAMTTVPKGTCVSFYCGHGETILDSTGNAIETGRPPVPTETFGPGAKIPDYQLFPPDGLTIRGNPVTVTGPTRISELLTDNMGGCHWAACRSVG